MSADLNGPSRWRTQSGLTLGEDFGLMWTAYENNAVGLVELGHWLRVHHEQVKSAFVASETVMQHSATLLDLANRLRSGALGPKAVAQQIELLMMNTALLRPISECPDNTTVMFWMPFERWAIGRMEHNRERVSGAKIDYYWGSHEFQETDEHPPLGWIPLPEVPTAGERPEGRG